MFPTTGNHPLSEPHINRPSHAHLLCMEQSANVSMTYVYDGVHMIYTEKKALSESGMSLKIFQIRFIFNFNHKFNHAETPNKIFLNSLLSFV
jgi:hypothetical protein